MQLYYIDISTNNYDFAEASPTSKVDFDYNQIECCPECGRYVSGAYWKHPREVVLTKHNAPDFLYCYETPIYLLSKRALDTIQSSGLSGIKKAEKIETVRFQRKSKIEMAVPEYYYIELERSRITINHSKSDIKYGEIADEIGPCHLCRAVPRTYDAIRSLSMNLEAYEGFDCFRNYELPGETFLSQRFVDVCRKAGLTNFNPQKIEQFKLFEELFKD